MAAASGNYSLFRVVKSKGTFVLQWGGEVARAAFGAWVCVEGQEALQADSAQVANRSE